MDDLINIVCATDDNFTQHCAVMMCSLLENTKSPEKVSLNVFLTEELIPENKQKIKDLVKKYNAQVSFNIVPKEYFDKLPIENIYTKNAYSRIFLHEMLPALKKAIYLDCDLIVEGDIQTLWNLPMNNKTISAIHNFGLLETYLWMNTPKNYYFNTGVLVIDIDKFNEKKIKEKVLDFSIKNSGKLVHPDQQALNYALNEDWNELPVKWNFLTPYLEKLSSKVFENHTQEIYTAIKNPEIIHFAGSKPTDPKFTLPFKSNYFKYLAKTPFKENMTSEEKKLLSVKNMLKEKAQINKYLFSLTPLGKKIMSGQNKNNAFENFQPEEPNEKIKIYLNNLQIPKEFDWKYYINRYSDLKKANINTEEKAKEHYLQYGKKEGRYPNKKTELIHTKLVPFLCEASPTWATKYLYELTLGEKLNLENPRNLNEKLQWIKLYWQHPLLIKCADKYTVREYLKEKGCEEILNELYQVYSTAEEIDFDKLPDEFVLKTNNACGTNIICTDKNKLNKKQTVDRLNEWLKMDYSSFFIEKQYSQMEPRIICEKFIKSKDIMPVDYKVFCFNGKAKLIVVVTDRATKKYKNFFFDTDWNRINVQKNEEQSKAPEKPAQLKELIDYAEKLSSPFPFVRMDFYIEDFKIIFGEMTFTPAAGLIQFITEEYMGLMGDWIKLPEKLNSQEDNYDLINNEEFYQIQKEISNADPKDQNNTLTETNTLLKTKTGSKSYFSIFCMFKDSAPFLKEWIEYHLILGAEHFYLYNNNSTDNYQKVLEPYVKAGIVDVIEWPFEPKYKVNFSIPKNAPSPLGGFSQKHAINDCLFYRAKGNTKWLAIIDADEFIVPKNTDDIKVFLKDYEQYGGLVISWKVFGTSNVKNLKKNELMIEKLVYSQPEDDFGEDYIKSIVQVDKVLYAGDSHYCIYKEPFFAVDPQGRRHFGSGKHRYPTQEKIILNHYFYRTEDDFKKVKTKYRPGLLNRFDKSKLDLANSTYNPSILRFVPRLREKMFNETKTGTALVPEEFDWKYYINRYSDLKKANINTEEKAKEHYWQHGKNEHREYFDKTLNKPINWFFCLNDNSLEFIELAKIAILSAEKFNLNKFCVYSGNNQEFMNFLKKHNTRLIKTEFSLKEKLLEVFPPARQQILLSTYLRVDLPDLILKEKLFEENYFLYTDCDVIFLNDPTSELKKLEPEFFCASSEFHNKKEDYFNAGIMWVNVKNMQKSAPQFKDYLVKTNFEGAQSDQGTLNKFYAKKYTFLDTKFNWKPYWGINPEAIILHFHGPKPSTAIGFINGNTRLPPAYTPLLNLKTLDYYKYYTDIYSKLSASKELD